MRPYGVTEDEERCAEFEINPLVPVEEQWEPEGASFYNGELIILPVQRWTQAQKLELLLYKLRRGKQDTRHEAYAIEVEELTQGLMLIETQWHRSQLLQRYPLVYVEALATAPWNRRLLEDPPYLRGVGRTLLLFTRQRSLELGYGGRVGLHALPGSEEFYRLNGMPEYDTDPEKEDLVYFEYGVLQR